MKSLGPVFIFGAGKVGSGLGRALKSIGVKVTVRAQRQGLPSKRIDAPFVILAVRDRDLRPLAEQIRDAGLLGHQDVVVVHCAGALGPEPLEPLRNKRIAVAQMHPMISFASKEYPPSLVRGQLHVDGDARAVRAAKALGKKLGMSPRTITGLDRVLYHASAGLVANGAAALAAGGVDLLGRAGVDPKTAAAMLGPLLRSVADNVEAMGLPAALTGPVRRGDASGVKRHLEMISKAAPHLVPIYVAASKLQLPLAREIGDAPGENFDAIAKELQGLAGE
jgi:predicted short-subunit dehydrogenase-like oxidoreductase (DUF2520 family)